MYLSGDHQRERCSASSIPPTIAHAHGATRTSPRTSINVPTAYATTSNRSRRTGLFTKSIGWRLTNALATPSLIQWGLIPPAPRRKSTPRTTRLRPDPSLRGRLSISLSTTSDLSLIGVVLCTLHLTQHTDAAHHRGVTSAIEAHASPGHSRPANGEGGHVTRLPARSVLVQQERDAHKMRFGSAQQSLCWTRETQVDNQII